MRTRRDRAFVLAAAGVAVVFLALVGTALWIALRLS